MESINSVLKPCPFCGGKAVLFVEHGVQVMCLSCGIGTPKITDRINRTVSQDGIVTSSIDRVIEAWNRRVDTNVCFSSILDR